MKFVSKNSLHFLFWPEADNSDDHNCNDEDHSGGNWSYDEGELLLKWLWGVGFRGQEKKKLLIWELVMKTTKQKSCK